MLTDIADSLSLCISSVIIQIPTRYTHVIHPEWILLSDHIPFMVKILMFEEHIQTRKRTIVKGRKEEFKFITDVTDLIKSLNTIHISNKEDLECIVQEFVYNTDKIWFKHSKMVDITKYLKLW